MGRGKECIYVSGPITAPNGYQMEHNIRKGMHKGGELAKQGYAPIVPHGNDYRWSDVGKFTWREYMEVDMELLKRADTVYMMEGWETSRGAKIEERYARLLRKKMIYERKEDNGEKTNTNRG